VGRTGGEKKGRENRVCRGLRWYSEAKSEKRREKSEKRAQARGGWLEGTGDESELPEGGLRVPWNGGDANVVQGVGRPGRERGRERYAHTEGGFPRLRYRHHRRRGGLYSGLSNTRKSAT